MKYKLGDVAKITRGVSYRSSDYASDKDLNSKIFINLKCASSNGFRNEGIKYYKGDFKPGQGAKEGDLLIACTDLTRNREIIGNSIKVPKINREACFSMDLAKITTDPEIVSSDFLYYYLKTPYMRGIMVGVSDGSTVVHLPTKILPEIEIDLPDLATQQKIVRILSALDNKIELNTQQLICLTETGKQVYDNYAKNATNNIKAIDKFEFIRGIEPGSETYKKEKGSDDVRFIRVGDMLSDTSENYVDKQLCAGAMLLEPDVAMSFDATIGRVSFGISGGYSSGIRKIKSKDGKISNAFIYYYLISDDVQKVLAENATGTTILHAGKAIEHLTLPYDETIIIISKRLNEIFGKQLFIKRQNNTLAKIRDTLLSKLINSEINLNGVQL